jgi:hypothetical protein
VQGNRSAVARASGRKARRSSPSSPSTRTSEQSELHRRLSVTVQSPCVRQSVQTSATAGSADAGRAI